MRGMNLYSAILYYLTSMLPAWIFLIINIITREQFRVFDDNENVLIVFLILVLLFSLLLKLLSKNFQNHTTTGFYFKPSHITTVNDGYMNFIVSFTAPNFIANNSFDTLYSVLLIHLIYHVILFFLYYNSSTIIPNIMLFLIGYQLYNFENMYWILTKEKTLRNYTSEIDTKRISNYLYLHIDKGEDV